MEVSAETGANVDDLFFKIGELDNCQLLYLRIQMSHYAVMWCYHHVIYLILFAETIIYQYFHQVSTYNRQNWTAAGVVSLQCLLTFWLSLVMAMASL